MTRKHTYTCDEPGCTQSVKTDAETAEFIGWSIELGNVYCPSHADAEGARRA